MNRLFLRFFAWFLAANLATAVATVLIARPALRAWQQDAATRAAELAREAVDLYEQQGAPALSDYTRRLIEREQTFIVVLRPDGRPAIPPPPELRWPLRNDRAASGPPDGQPPGRGRPVQRVEADGHEGRYRLLVRLGPDDARALRALGPLRLIISALILALLALVFSQALVRPLQKLTQAVRRIGAGDLTARAGPDIGPRKDEIGELAREFDRMASQTEQLIGSQQRLLRDISHELRSPLARLEVALELARQRGGPEAELDRIGLEAARLADLISEILDYTRLQAAPEAPTTTVDLAQLVREAAADARFAGGSDTPPVAVSAPDTLPVPGDPAQLRSALDNLLRNAQKYAPGPRPVELSLNRDGDQAHLRVRDYGPGVAADQLERIFDPFVRVSGARDRGSGGYGIGLAIVAGITRRHGGRVQASNCADGGLAVDLRLPLQSR